MLRSCHQMESMPEFDPCQLVWQISATLAYAYELYDDPDSQTDGRRHSRLDCLSYNTIFEHIKNMLFHIESLLQIDLILMK